MHRSIRLLSLAAGFLVLALLPSRLASEETTQMAAPAAGVSQPGGGDPAMECPGKADGSPCCAGCEARTRISKGKATGCPCKERARQAAEAEKKAEP
jgi:hypothetical protein